jgi:hypothetical protein
MKIHLPNSNGASLIHVAAQASSRLDKKDDKYMW